MNRSRTILVGALLAVPVATVGISGEAAFAGNGTDTCGAITDNPDPRDCEKGMGFSLGSGDSDEEPPPTVSSGGCPVMPYSGGFVFNCSMSPMAQAQPLEAAAVPAAVQEQPEGGGGNAVAAATAAALLAAVGAPIWIRRMRRTG